jgi:hypothetical protein
VHCRNADSLLNNLKVIVAAHGDRELNDRDRFELSTIASTLSWLASDKAIICDLSDIQFDIPQTDFAAAYSLLFSPGAMPYRQAMTTLHRALVEGVLMGR